MSPVYLSTHLSTSVLPVLFKEKSGRLIHMQSLLILGRQPALGMAELESLYGYDVVRPFSGTSALVDIPADQVAFSRLGGSTRLCKVLTELSPQWHEVKQYLLDKIPEHAALLPEGKLTIGLSLFGIKTHIKELERTLLEIKKVVKQSGRPVRIVPNKQLELNSAQVLHNHLTEPGNWELVVVSDGRKAYLTQTVAIQDIEAYGARDQARPYRDARVGMLPPKLAQVIVNLAVGSAAADEAAKTDLHSSVLGGPVLDPFCGTGVTLQEATLMGYDSFGTDLEPRMVEYSIGNLHWLRQKWPDRTDTNVRIELGDATTHAWHQPIGAVAGETYLGAPLTTLPQRDALNKIIGGTNAIHEKFLRNLASQLQPGTRLCLAVPAWNTGQSAHTGQQKPVFTHLPVLDHLQELGYNRVKFVHADMRDLVYHRENQLVARELVVIVKE